MIFILERLFVLFVANFFFFCKRVASTQWFWNDMHWINRRLNEFLSSAKNAKQILISNYSRFTRVVSNIFRQFKLYWSQRQFLDNSITQVIDLKYNTLFRSFKRVHFCFSTILSIFLLKHKNFFKIWNENDFILIDNSIESIIFWSSKSDFCNLCNDEKIKNIIDFVSILFRKLINISRSKSTFEIVKKCVIQTWRVRFLFSTIRVRLFLRTNWKQKSKKFFF